MRNALLSAAAGAVLLGLLVWWRPAQSPPSPPSAANPAPVSSPPPAAAAAPTLSPQPRAATAHAPDAAELTQRASERLNAEPAAALSDIEQADRLDSAPDARRRALEIFALVRVGRVGHARALADRFYRAFPGHPEIPQIERLTGYHPRPYGPPPTAPK